LQILNTGNSDIQALTVEIPKQESIIIKGANKVIVGDLDSNEYTTADFESIPSDGKFNVNLIYSDENNIRRITTEEVTFDSSYFKDRPSSQKKAGIGTYIFYLIIIVLIIYLVYRFAWKRKKK